MVDMVDSEWSVIPASHKRAGNLCMHARARNLEDMRPEATE